MKQKICSEIARFVRSYEMRPEILTRWGEPLVGFAWAGSSAMQELRQSVSPDHLMPADILPEANVVVAYFLPFTPGLSATNVAGTAASSEWARAYRETNALFAELNDLLMELIRSHGGTAAVPGSAAGFAGDTLMSRWSHRHFAVLAGLGTFGVNNMLITRAGCCGRVSSFPANIAVETDTPLSEELCLYKQKGVCGKCFARCPSGALSPDGFDRALCYSVCMKNEARYPGCDVCGKCAVGLPCSFRRE